MTPTPDAIGFYLLALPAFGLALVLLTAPFELTARGRRIADRILRALFGELPR